MLNPIIWNNLSIKEQAEKLQRPLRKNDHAFKTQVQTIIDEVKYKGDIALRQFTSQYDRVDLTSFQVSPAEFEQAQEQIAPQTLDALNQAINCLTHFHGPQILNAFSVETAPGVLCENQPRALNKIGIYIPGGTAPLISSVLMLGVPSKIAGCQNRILCSPPDQQGNINPAILMAAKLCNITTIYKLGGAQAIAAMAYGTETIPKVDKIFGPGNAWVTQAKLLVAQDPNGADYDLPAGPSEVMVIADENANPEFIAADLLSQAEHGPDSQVFLVCTDENIIDRVQCALSQQIKLLPRAAIALNALENSCSILVETLMEAIAIANAYAPEHLILQVTQPRVYMDAIHAAGSVFLGPWSPESAGDYASGTNHVLPTYGFAKTLSGLSVRDFMKTISFQELTRTGLTQLAPTICELARLESLDAHKNAVDIRLSTENDRE